SDLFGLWRELADERRWGELFRSLLEDSGVMFDRWDAGDADRRLANYRLIMQTLEQAACGHDLDAAGVLELFEQMRRRPPDDDSDLQPIETDQPKVRILTIHASKGLEFPVVFLAGGFTSGKHPICATYHDNSDQRLVFDLQPDEAARMRAAQEQQAEERRLLYVALTRAMFLVYVPRLNPDDHSP